MKIQSKQDRPTVIVIDDDGDVREALDGLFRSVGLRVLLFASAQEFLEFDQKDVAGCMVLDVRLPGKNGLDFHDEMVRAGSHKPVVFISGHADVPMSVRAMKAGAVEFLTKPVRDQDLLDAVQRAIDKDLSYRDSVRGAGKICAMFDTLTVRERQIFALAVSGHRNRDIAAETNISEATVKLHRGHMMQKMQAQSLADLIRMAETLRLVRREIGP